MAAETLQRSSGVVSPISGMCVAARESCNRSVRDSSTELGDPLHERQRGVSVVAVAGQSGSRQEQIGGEGDLVFYPGLAVLALARTAAPVYLNGMPSRGTHCPLRLRRVNAHFSASGQDAAAISTVNAMHPSSPIAERSPGFLDRDQRAGALEQLRRLDGRDAWCRHDRLCSLCRLQLSQPAEHHRDRVPWLPDVATRTRPFADNARACPLGNANLTQQ